MFIFYAIKEEWYKCTTLGRATWVPLFAVLLPLAVVVFIPLIPLLYLLTLFDRQITRCQNILRRLFFRGH